MNTQVIPNSIWQRRKLITRKNGKRRDTHIPIICPTCKSERWLKLHDARKAIANATPCKSCHCSVVGKKGYAATMALLGFEGWLEILAKKQRENPPKSEQTMAELLTNILPVGYCFEVQVVYGRHILDFVICSNEGESWEFIIEVNGYWHKRRGAKRDATLVATSLMPVVFIDADLLTSERGLKQVATIVNDQLKKESCYAS